MVTETVEKGRVVSHSGIAIVVFMVTCEVSKQISNYYLLYIHGGHCPIPLTVLVILIEFVKLIFTVVRSRGDCPLRKRNQNVKDLRSSLKYLMPSILYTLNNNIYFYGLTLVSPPIWIILCSLRTVFTATVYKFVLRRNLSMWQFVGVMLIVISIGVAKIPDLVKPGSIDDEVSSNDDSVDELGKATTSVDVQDTVVVNALPISAILLGMVASLNSVIAALYTESLFKKGTDSFLDQQFWLYLYSGIVAILVHLVTSPITLMEIWNLLSAMAFSSHILMCICIAFSSVGGLVVASILKHLDNIVKEYSGSLANVLTALTCAFLFPDKFQLTTFIGLSMILLSCGIYLYETKKTPQYHGRLT